MVRVRTRPVKRKKETVESGGSGRREWIAVEKDTGICTICGPVIPSSCRKSRLNCLVNMRLENFYGSFDAWACA